MGSRKGKGSTTLGFVKAVLNKTIESVGEDKIKVDLYTPTSSKIDNCKGCSNCFFKVECPQDKNDDMKIIKEKMINADFIIFASPVYVHNVSGDMKIFFDRIGYWTHIMRLSGKAGIAIATSSGNGLDLTVNYIHKIMVFLGIKVVGRFGVIPYLPKDEVDNLAKKCSNIIIEFMNGKKIESDNQLEFVFKTNKDAIKLQENINSSEYRYWNESGLLKCNSFEEVLSTIEKE